MGASSDETILRQLRSSLQTQMSAEFEHAALELLALRSPQASRGGRPTNSWVPRVADVLADELRFTDDEAVQELHDDLDMVMSGVATFLDRASDPAGRLRRAAKPLLATESATVELFALACKPVSKELGRRVIELPKAMANMMDLYGVCQKYVRGKSAVATEDQMAAVLLMRDLFLLDRSPSSVRNPNGVADLIPEALRVLDERGGDRLDSGWGSRQLDGRSFTISIDQFEGGASKYYRASRALCVQLLALAATVEPPVGALIHISSRVFDDSRHDLRNEYHRALHAALDRGWNVVAACSQAADADSTQLEWAQIQAELTHHLMVSVQTPGTYIPRLGETSARTGVVVAEGLGAVAFERYGPDAVDGRLGPSAQAWSPVLTIRAFNRVAKARQPKQGAMAAPPRPLHRRVKKKKSPVGVVNALAELAAGDQRPDPATDGLLHTTELPAAFRLPAEDLIRFDGQLTSSEWLEGDRFLLKPPLSTSTLPPDLSTIQFDAFASELQRLHSQREKTEATGLFQGADTAQLSAQAKSSVRSWGSADAIEQAVDELRQLRSMRHRAFLRNSTTHRYWDITTKENLMRYLAPPENRAGATTDRWLDANPIYGGGGLTYANRRRHVEFLIDRLERTAADIRRKSSAQGGQHVPGYRLGIVSEPANLRFVTDRPWMIVTRSTNGRADQVHYMYGRDNGAGTLTLANLRRRAIADFGAARTAHAYFDIIWNELTPYRAPDKVAKYLRDLLDERPS